jgi:hypothetical protein
MAQQAIPKVMGKIVLFRAIQKPVHAIGRETRAYLPSMSDISGFSLSSLNGAMWRTQSK